MSEEETRATIARLSDDAAREAAGRTSSATARNRRHRPGRGFETLRYRFEIVSDYGAFRDLQRHRMLTVQWQALTPDLGAGVPERGRRGRAAATTTAARWSARGRSTQRLVDAGLRGAAPYALCLGYRIRYVLDLNAREAMQLIELRSGREGHPTYRAVAHEMHRQIAAVHPIVGRRDDARGHGDRAAARARALRDAHPGEAGRRGGRVGLADHLERALDVRWRVVEVPGGAQPPADDRGHHARFGEPVAAVVVEVGDHDRRVARRQPEARAERIRQADVVGMDRRNPDLLDERHSGNGRHPGEPRRCRVEPPCRMGQPQRRAGERVIGILGGVPAGGVGRDPLEQRSGRR